MTAGQARRAGPTLAPLLRFARKPPGLRRFFLFFFFCSFFPLVRAGEIKFEPSIHLVTFFFFSFLILSSFSFFSLFFFFYLFDLEFLRRRKLTRGEARRENGEGRDGARARGAVPRLVEAGLTMNSLALALE